MAIRKIMRKKGVGYQVTVQLTPTKQVSKKFARKVDAEAWEREQLQAKSAGLTTATSSSMTFGELASTWLESYAKLHLEGTSLVRYRVYLTRQLLPTFGSKRLRDLRQQAVEAWLLGLRDGGLAPKTCNDCLGLFRKILNDGVRWGHIPANPIQGARRLKKEEQEFRFWTTDEARAFLAHVDEAEPELYPAFFLALNTGMRLGEIGGLKWDCVDLERQQITVKRSWCQKEHRVKERTKSGKIRLVPMNAALRDVLIGLRGKNDSSLVFPGHDFKNLVRKQRSLAKAAGVRTIKFHDLRHTFASLWMMAGNPIFELQKVLGHSTIQMTERYSHLAPEHLAGKTEFLDLAVTRATAKVLSLRPAP